MPEQPAHRPIRDDVAHVAARFTELWAQPDLDGFIELLHPDVRLYQPMAAPILGRQAALDEFARLFEMLPDLKGTVDHWAADGSFLLIAWRLRATFGRAPYEWPIADHIRVEDRLIIERRALFDPLAVFGAILRGGPRAWVGYARYRARI